ncbi:hypothetical protein MUG84_04390 [Paenibacillus sp. KQZ6P-2]|uniref:Uncharacterized protein n=1 Tax=Paenibacillus mangrovi TaxID=2931978 RepID=A0A9X2B170_9BACL|nr:hypothetical protein [Paenibacillus mangrovi]MCJ8010981.1 hypothetical protein [Paenibacillus mangrovi]
MQLIYPISEDGIRPHVGKRVCAVLCDGRYYYGTMTDVRDGHIFLGGNNTQIATTCSSKITKPKTRLKSVSISRFFPGSRAGLGLSLATLGFLFLI